MANHVHNPRNVKHCFWRSIGLFTKSKHMTNEGKLRNKGKKSTQFFRFCVYNLEEEMLVLL